RRRSLASLRVRTRSPRPSSPACRSSSRADAQERGALQEALADGWSESARTASPSDAPGPAVGFIGSPLGKNNTAHDVAAIRTVRHDESDVTLGHTAGR